MAKEKRSRVLVLCVDRDNDLGEKTSSSGPLLGREKVLNAARDLGLADPEDSDCNAMFETVRVHDEMKESHEVEAAVLTGDRSVGIKSDEVVSKQMDSVLKKFSAEGVVLVTDGVEDEHIIPIIQSKVPIISVRRVIIKQSEQLESTYYKIKDFIQESLENPKLSRLFFGVPAMILILLGIFGLEGGRVIVGVIGLYLLIKGFKLEKYFVGVYDELRTSFTGRRLAFFSYIVSAALGIFAVYRGYLAFFEWMNMGLFEAVAAFFSSAIYLLFLVGTIAWVGRSISMKKRNFRRIAVPPIFMLAITVVIHSASELILNPSYVLMNFIFSIILGFALLFLALLIERKG